MADEQTGVWVVGQGQVAAPPDVAIVNLGASVLRARPDDAFDRTAQLLQAVTVYLRSQGVAEGDIVTSNLSLHPEYRAPARGQDEPAVAGWRARHGLTVRVRDFAALGRIVSEAVSLLEEAGEMQGISFAVEENERFISLARDAAVDDARQKAEQIAARLGVRLGSVTFVQELSGSTPVPRPAAEAMLMKRSLAADAVPAPISAGDQSFRVAVEVHYSLAGGSTV